MKFWDASALVPLLVEESTTKRLTALAARDSAMLVWWASEVECVSALARLERDGAIDADIFERARARLTSLAKGWHEVQPSDPIRVTAVRLLRVHPLRAADALQLAAAWESCERLPASLEVVTLDDRLAVAARREGFAVLV
jgi:uncharacterized protein